MDKILPGNKKQRNERTVFIFSIFVFLYFVFLILSYRLGFDSLVIIQVFRELLDIPAFALVIIFLVLSVISYVKGKFRSPSYPFYSIIILLASIAIMLIFV